MRYAWGEDWFGRILPPLLALQLVVLVAWGTLALDRARNGHAAAPTPTAQLATPEQVSTPPAPVDVRIRENGGSVGALRLGMTVGQVRGALGDGLVTVQHARGRSGRFELLHERAGLRLAGARGRIDTVTVLDTPAGERWVTSRGVRVGHSRYTVPRKYAYARLICGREYWIARGANTLRVTVQARVTKISLTSRSAPRYVDCFA